MKAWELKELNGGIDDGTGEGEIPEEFRSRALLVSERVSRTQDKITQKIGGSQNYPRTRTGDVIGFDTELPSLGLGYRAKDT